MHQSLLRDPVAAVLDGTVAYLDTGAHAVVPPGVIDDPVELLRGFRGMFSGQPEATVVLEKPWGPDAAAQLDQAGWKFTNLHHLEEGGWTRLQLGAAVLHVGLADAIAVADPKRQPLYDGGRPELFAARLGRYHRATGTAWCGTAGMAGCNAVRSLYTDGGAGKQPRWFSERPTASSAARLRGVDALLWRAPAAAWREDWKFIHTFDTRAAYVAAANTAELAWPALAHTGPILFDAAMPGYWLVSQIHIPDTRVPLYTRAWARDGAVWLTTPTMQLLSDLGHHPDIYDSWTAPRGVRILKPWAEKLRDALDHAEREAKDPVQRAALKRTWSETVGLFGRAGGRIWRPDWRDMLIDRARANLTRKIRSITAGGAPFQAVEVVTDMVRFLSPHALPGKVTGEGVQVGKLVYKGTQTVEDFLMENPHA